MISKAIDQGLWVPTAEAAATVGAALAAHWAAAKAAAARNPFILKAPSWLERPAHHLAHHHLTIGGRLIK